MAGSRPSWATRRFESLSQNERKMTKRGQSAGKLWEERPEETAWSLTILPIFLHGHNDTLRMPDLQCTQKKEDTHLQKTCKLLRQLQLS